MSKSSVSRRTAPGATSSHPWAHALAGALLLASLVFIAYFPALTGGFIWDDTSLITDSNLVKAPDGLRRIWLSTEPYDYWPVTNSLFWLEWRLWGMNSTGYHIVNLLLQIANSLLLWLVLRKMLIPGAFLAALLFAVHPVNVESVAWISQGKNTLSLLFFLLSVLSYLKVIAPAEVLAEHRFFLRSLTRWYWLSLLAFVLAMLSKGSVAILPLVLLLIIWWQRGKIHWADWLRMLPFFIVAALLTGVNIWFRDHGAVDVIRDVTSTQRLIGAGAVVWFYLYKSLLPINLVFVYPSWSLHTAELIWWLPLAASIAVTVILPWRRRDSRTRWLLLAWLYFCVALVPVMGLTDVYYMKYSPVADHYQYVALAAVVASIAAAWSFLRERLPSASLKWVSSGLASLVILALTSLTFAQSRLYRDATTLYLDTLEQNPACWLAYNNLGLEQMRSGFPQQAVDSLQMALRLNPNLPQAQNNLGIIAEAAGRPEEAIGHYREAVRLKPDFPEALYNLASTLAKVGRFEEAIHSYREAIRLKPDFPDAFNNLGWALTKVGRFEEAIDAFLQVMHLQPDNADAYANLSLAYEAIGNSAKAIDAAQTALSMALRQGDSELARQVQGWLNSHTTTKLPNNNAAQGAGLLPSP